MDKPAENISVAFVVTTSLHLATMLGTAGCEPFRIVRGPEKTPQGTPQVRWLYKSTPKSDEIIAMWKSPKHDTRPWEELTQEEKEILISMQTAFAANLRHFLAQAKGGEL